MSSQHSGSISARCEEQGATLKLSFDVGELVAELKKSLQARLAKKDVTVDWTDQTTEGGVLVRLVEVDQGNQFLRWLVPFAAPAVLEVEGYVAVAGVPPQPFHYVERGQMGFFGGGGRELLAGCASRVASRVAKDVLAAVGARGNGRRQWA